MLVKKADDYQSWYIEEDGHGILIDPWLDKKLNPSFSFFLQRRRKDLPKISSKELSRVKSIIITAPFKDHIHIPSLKMLGPDITIFSNNLVKALLKLNGLKNPFFNIRNEKKIGSLEVRSIPSNFPYKSTTFSFILKNKIGKTLFHESHVANLKYIIKNGLKCDVCILTAEKVSFLGVVPLSMDINISNKVVNELGANILMLNSTNPEMTVGFIKKLLYFDREDSLKKINIKVFKNSGDSFIL